MYKVLGFVNIGIFVLLTSPYWVRKSNQWFIHSKSKKYTSLLKFLHTIHKWVGLVFLIVIPVHGYLALGGFYLHTGTVLGISCYLTALIGLVNFFAKKPKLLMIHKLLALLDLALIIIHYFLPSLLG